MKKINEKLLEKMGAKMVDIKKLKYLMFAFWICTAFALAPHLIGMGRPCAMCLIQNSLVTLIAAICFFAKWYAMLINIGLWLTFLWALAAIYHGMIVLKIIHMPAFCNLNATFFQKALSACNASSIWMVASSLILALIVFYLLKKAK